MIEDIIKIIESNRQRLDRIEEKLMTDAPDSIHKIRIDELNSIRDENHKINMIVQTALVDYFSAKVSGSNK